MLVAHGAIEAPLRDLVAGRVEVNGTEALVGFVLGENRLRESKAGRDRGGSDGGC
jgi:hypothetical protein